MMKNRIAWTLVGLCALFAAGCGKQAADAEQAGRDPVTKTRTDPDVIQRRRARLSLQEGEPVEAPKGAARNPEVKIEGEPVFLSSDADEQETAVHGENTLAKAQELRRQTRAALEEQRRASAVLAERIEKNRAGLRAPDRQAVAAQEFCPIQTRNRLGLLGPPVKVTIKGQTVFLCCPACKETALAYPDGTLAKVQELKRRARNP